MLCPSKNEGDSEERKERILTRLLSAIVLSPTQGNIPGNKDDVP